MILLVGGTGMLGRRLIDRLGGEGIRVMTRDPEKAADLRKLGVELVEGDLRDPATVGPALDGVKTVVAAANGMLGPRGTSPATVDRDGNVNLIDAADASGAEVVMLSVVGASADTHLEVARMKYAAEEHLRSSSASWTIIQATAFAELWIGILRQTAAKSGRPLVFGNGENPVNFVAVEDVTALVLQTLDDRSTRREVLRIGGPEQLTLNQLATLVQSVDGRDKPPRHLPRTMLHLTANTAGLVVPQLRRQAQAALFMDSGDRSFDATAIHDRFPTLPSTTVREVLGTT